MTAFGSLIDAECGTINPLVQLTQIYTHNPQNNFSEHDQSIIAPHTFHLPSLLANFDRTDRTAKQWTEEFLKTSSSDDIRSKSVTNMDFSDISWATYSSPCSFFIPHPNLLFFNQFDTEFDNDTVRATQNLLSFLRESQHTVHTEDRKIVDKKEQQLENILGEINPFQAGLKCLEIHDTANAILYFQIAVQKQPDHIDAWLCLGVVQAENEQDTAAITALKKCIELDSRNLLAHLTLASCYANEMQKSEALISLYRWLANNTKYSQILSNRPSYPVVYDPLIFEDLKDLFFQAIAFSNTLNEIDADLQVCVGILFYLNDDYTKAAECFQTAIFVKPNDAILWNKLGASIANSGKNEKAVHAYHRALTLSPGYIRARYNLGISCLNLKAYKQAVEHLLIALKLQIPMNTSENIWRTLANAIHHLNRSDLEQCVVFRDLPKLLHEFQIA